MAMDDEIGICPRRPRIVSNVNLFDDQIDVKEPIRINGGSYNLNLVYDHGEKGNKNRNERVQMHEQFNRYQQIHAKPCQLSIGDFVWTLQNIQNEAEEWLYPVIIERKRMDDLVCSLRDKRYFEQKWRMKHFLPDFDHIYLVEEHPLNDIEQRQVKQALVDTEVVDNFLLYQTKTLIECIRVLSRWTHMIYKQIINKLEQNGNDYDFFESEELILFQFFNKAKNYKKNLNIPAKILFGRQLMSIPYCTDSIASAIVNKYPTMRLLHMAWSECENEQKQKMLLYEEVNGTCLEWHRDLDSGWIDLDDDLKNVCSMIDNAKFKPISKNLSEKIWNSFYNCNQ